MLFKKEYHQGVFSYLNILQPPVTAFSPLVGVEPVLYNYEFRTHIALAEYLMSHLDKYMLIRFSPYLSKLPFINIIETINWKYELLASDRLGLGVDKGFLNVKELSKEANSLCAVDNLLPLTTLPEDTFGDAVSWISIFGLKSDKETALKAFLQSVGQPHLTHFLQKGEVFVHIINSKEEGFYHSMLIKSAEDIEEKIYAFQTIIDPNN
jgi:hypothetical protein